jgi:hypothetical protein
MCKPLKARTPADLILKFRKAHGVARIEGDSLRTIQALNEKYDVTASRSGFYVATPKAPCAEAR